MASQGPIYALNVGTQTVGLARFVPSSSGGLVLDGYRFTRILGDPAAEITRIAQTKLALNEVVHALKAKGAPVAYALPGQSVFSRFVKLPPVTPDKVEQIINFEAQQNVPFPLNEVVWDYQILSDISTAAQTEVVLVAIKADGLDELNEAIQSSSLKTSVVDIAPAALYNSLRYNYSDLNGCTMLVDLGSRTTNLIFAEGSKVFSRSIPIGGSTITQAIAKEFHESFTEAEERKCKTGYVGLGGAYADPPDPDVAKCSKIIRNTMTRIHAEIARSITFYRSQQGGAQPVRIFLCGGSSSLPYMREFFQEKFQAPVEYFNPLRNVAVSKGVSLDQVVKDAHLLGELVGLALRLKGSCPLELNLLPKTVVRAQSLAAQRPWLIAAALGLFGILGALFLYFDRGATSKAEVLSSVTQQVTSLQRFDSKLKALQEEQNKLKDVAERYMRAIEERDAWLRVLNALNSALPENYIWITSLEPLSGGKPLGADRKTLEGTSPTGPRGGKPTPQTIDAVAVKGLYLFNNEAKEQIVNVFVKQLSESPQFKLDLSNQRSVIPRLDSQNNRDWAFHYELVLTLAHPISL